MVLTHRKPKIADFQCDGRFAVCASVRSDGIAALAVHLPTRMDPVLWGTPQRV